MQPSELRRLIERVLGTSLLSPLLLTGCGPNLEGYSAPACEEGQLAVTGLTPEPAVDLVQLRAFACGSPPGSEQRVRASSGTACATASDTAACQAALAALAPGTGFVRSGADFCELEYLATTRGDAVQAHTTEEAVRSLFGRVDALQEAALLVHLANFSVSCHDLGRGAVKEVKDGFSVIATRGVACGPGTALVRHYLHVSPDGVVRGVGSEVIEVGDPKCVIGRRPAGLREEREARCRHALGDHFARAARLEAASVEAFLRLHDELALHGAPEALQRWALRSAREEVQHARVTARLARRFGGRPVAPQVDPLPLRPRLEVALENAVEGCVRETYGALVGHHQALHARDPEVRAAFAQIAADETRHAALSWQVHAWAQGMVGRRERALLREAQARAVTALRGEVTAPVDEALVTDAGVPAPGAAVALVDGLARGLWG